MRILGIDYGDSRIGVSVSDPFGWTAQGLETINASKGMQFVFKRLQEIMLEYKVEKIVVGFPINMNGTIGDRGIKTEKFINLLKEKFDVPVQKWDERLTTVAAQRLMNESNIKNKKKKGLIDTISSTYILQGYLDSIR
ncbi:MAG: Holliday junction resolvase RuvX [Deltaproteobacteria bacterium]